METIAMVASAVPHAITTFLDRETPRLHGFIARVHEAIDRLKELRTALISAVVTGKIDVREFAHSGAGRDPAHPDAAPDPSLR